MTQPAGCSPPIDFAETSLAFARISCAVRLTLALHARLEAGSYRPFPGAARDADPETGRPVAPRPAASDMSDARLGDPPEHLSDRNELAALLDQPAGVLIARICRDLGLAPDQAAAAQAGWGDESDDLETIEAAQDAQDEAPALLAANRREGVGLAGMSGGKARGP
jgi:hypothetical protein